MTCSEPPICCNGILMTLASMRLGAAILLTSQQTRRWWEKNTEIDIVAADYERLHCLVGECKYRNEKVGLKVFRSLQAKCVHLPVHEDAVFHYWLFSRSGFEDSVKELAERDPYLHLVGMEELLD